MTLACLEAFGHDLGTSTLKISGVSTYPKSLSTSPADGVVGNLAGFASRYSPDAWRVGLHADLKRVVGQTSCLSGDWAGKEEPDVASDRNLSRRQGV